MAAETTPRWNGEPCEARKVVVVVADNPEAPNYWARPFVGQERNAVEVTYGGATFYLDDEGYESTAQERELLRRYGFAAPEQVGYPGWGWAKVMAGGGPGQGHASLRVERVVRERA